MRRGFGGRSDRWGFSAKGVLRAESTGVREGLGEASMKGGDFWGLGWEEREGEGEERGGLWSRSGG